MILQGYRTYIEKEVVTFMRNNDEYGPLSNMYGMPVVVDGEPFNNSEALYQALRLPKNPEAQRKIQQAKNGMAAKITAYGYEKEFRSDWHDKINGRTIKIDCMRFTLWQKMAVPENRNILVELLKRRGNKTIVEKSYKDQFWGAKPQPDGSLVGCNVLGRLWMEIGQKIQENPDFPFNSELPKIPNLMLFGKELEYPYIKLDMEPHQN